jgi:hypothetical protein
MRLREFIAEVALTKRFVCGLYDCKTVEFLVVVVVDFGFKEEG